MIDEVAADPLPVCDRPARVAALQAQIEELQRVEEMLVQQALDNGYTVTRSPNAPPWAVLGVAVGNGEPKRRRRKVMEGEGRSS